MLFISLVRGDGNRLLEIGWNGLRRAAALFKALGEEVSYPKADYTIGKAAPLGKSDGKGHGFDSLCREDGYHRERSEQEVLIC
jgi:hypothetical protein